MHRRIPDYRILLLGGAVASLVFLVIPAMARDKLQLLRTVPHVDLARYMGDWRALQAILGRLREQGYDTKRFLPVPQFPEQLNQPNAATRS